MSDTLEELREKIAAIQHDQWSGWMKYLFSKCKYDNIEGLVIPVEYVKRWNRQMLTPYNELPENEKESDRIEADKLLALFSKELSIIEKKKDENLRLIQKRLRDVFGINDDYINKKLDALSKQVKE